jgi:hypothetical protein
MRSGLPRLAFRVRVADRFTTLGTTRSATSAIEAPPVDRSSTAARESLGAGGLAAGAASTFEQAAASVMTAARNAESSHADLALVVMT